MKKQIRKLYGLTIFESLTLGGASWVALLAIRGYSLAQIGVIEAVFHAVSLCGEIPSGVIADVLGRKNTMIASRIMRVLSAIAMIVSGSFLTICIAIAINALSYNLASGTREALAYDSLKEVGKEDEYNKYASNEMMLYRFFSALSTLLAGLALYVGYKISYSVDVVFGTIGIIIAFLVADVAIDKSAQAENIFKACADCVKESALFLKNNPKSIALIAINSVVGAISTLILFFLQAKLPELGLPNAFLGPALFIMGLGAALGAKVVQYFSKTRFIKIIITSILGVSFALATIFFHNPYFIIVGGFIGSFSDDFLQVRADVVLNDMIPSEQRATLISVCSFAFSIVMIVLSPVMGWILGMI